MPSRICLAVLFCALPFAGDAATTPLDLAAHLAASLPAHGSHELVHEDRLDAEREKRDPNAQRAKFGSASQWAVARHAPRTCARC